MKGKALFHCIKHMLNIDPPQSQTTVLEQNTIKKYAENAKIAVEIGVFEGLNTVSIAKFISPEGKLYAIDPFFKGSLGISYGKIIANTHTKRNNVSDRVIFIEKFSYEAAKEIPNDIDFIFIDGDHSLEGIKRDWSDWSVKTKKGGIIALHDTSIPVHDPTVSQLGSYQYFNSFIMHDKRFEVIETVDSLNILRKKN